jgi:single-strand DNA-binding protein
MGRLTADPELRTTNNGTSVTSFTVAVDRDYVKQGEERQTDFINVVVWRQAAEFVSRNFSKGSMISVQGSIQTRNYEDKHGNKRVAVEIIADKVSFTGEKREQQTTRYDAVPSFDMLDDSDDEDFSFGTDGNKDDGLPF